MYSEKKNSFKERLQDEFIEWFPIVLILDTLLGICVAGAIVDRYLSGCQ